MRNFCLLVAAQVLLQFAFESLLLKDTLYYDALIDQLSFERITELLKQGKKWMWFSYTLIPIYLVIKLFFVSVCFYIGAILLDLRVGFDKFFEVASTSEFLFLVPKVVKLVWFYFFKIDYTLDDLHQFSPLSFINLVNSEGLDYWFVYPIQLFNVFELLYWLMLAYMIRRLLNQTFLRSFSFVAKTYGVGLAVWVVFVVFLLVSLS